MFSVKTHVTCAVCGSEADGEHKVKMVDVGGDTQDVVLCEKCFHKMFTEPKSKLLEGVYAHD